jgi:uncharacterized phage protein gp47/JayE
MPADFPTRLDLYSLARQYVLSRASKIDPAQVDVEGSDVNLFTGIASVIGYQVTLGLIQNINALLLDGAYDEDLDRYGVDRYQLPRKGAAAAVTDVRIFRVSTAGGAGTIPSNTSLTTLNGIEYITTTAASLGPLDLTTTAQVRAVQAGKVSQVGANQIRAFATPGLLFDQTLQVNNDTAAAGGEDTEDDDDYRERIRDFWRTAQRGTLAAIEFGARTVPGVVSALASEALTSDPRPARVVNLYIADSSGVASAALGATVQATLNEFRAAGISVVIANSIPQIVDVELHLTFAANTDTTVLTQVIRANMAEFINSLGVGEVLYRAALFSVLQRFSGNGLIVSQNTVVVPTGDLAPATGQTLRTRLENVTVA